MIGIYKIISPTGRIYIGQSINIEKRFSEYRNAFCKKQPRLLRSFTKYGIGAHAFEVIEECNIASLNNRERHYQDLFDATNGGLNCQLTTSDTKSGKHSEESLAKMRGRKFTDEHRAKISQGNKGKIRTTEHAAKLGLVHKGKIFSKEQKDKMGLSMKGKTHTIESKNKMSAALKGRTFSEETKANFSAAQQKRMLDANERAKFGKMVVCTQTGIFYLTGKEAAEAYNLNYSTLKNRLNGNCVNNTTLVYV
jgi:group I intron endonuclease